MENVIFTRMHRLLIAAISLVVGVSPLCAQSMDDLNIQIHGYATQGFLYTTNNNILTTNSSGGSPAWTEAVVNVTAQPSEKLRVAVQARYFMLGTLGNQIDLDYASADYKVNDKLGFSFGKVKRPLGLFNESQDIDPAYLWSLLPQTVYPLESRNSLLTDEGGLLYGRLKFEGKSGSLEYRAWGGELSMGPNDGYFVNQKEEGISLTNGLSGSLVGASLRWRTPIEGLMIGASDERILNLSGPFVDMPIGLLFGVPSGIPGTEAIKAFDEYYLFSRYDGKKLMLAAEYNRVPLLCMFLLPLLPQPYNSNPFREDHKSWYGMVGYKLTGKLSAGTYYTQDVDHQAALGAARYLKDLAISGRYDLNQFLYAKVEQHFVAGTAGELGLYDNAMNSGGLKPTTKMTILKIGVSF